MRYITILFAAFILSPLIGQVSHGGTPSEWEHALSREDIPVIALHAPTDLPDLTGEPGAGDFNYGVQRFIELDVPAQGVWTDLPNGDRICRVAIVSQDAVMLSLQFDRWDIPEGAMVYLYDDDRENFIGGFNHTNRGPNGELATAVIQGEMVIVEYRLPSDVPVGDLHIASLTHGYRDIFGFNRDRDIDPGYQSSPCNVNINCPEAADWQDQKRAVALFLRPSGDGCNGVLLNNTAEPGRPFFHLAAHCSQDNHAQWVFYFNYESAGCVGTSGPSNQTVSGSIYRAGWYYTDFVLVELSSAPPASYNPYYAGWDRTGNTPQTGTVIHHPLFDVKKISLNYGPVTSHTYASGWITWRNYWDAGLVQAVSSGAPMFDQNKRMVGHMFNGGQECEDATTVPTDCAKFSESWNSGPTPDARLRDWLDPSNTVMVLDGYDPNTTAANVKVRVRAHLEGPFNTSNNLMNATLRASGLVPLTEPYSAAGYAHVNGGGGETTTNTVLGVTGTNSIVDWVVIELRNKNNSQQVLATRSALIQRDGDIVDVDGISDVTFDVAPDQYYIAVRHRNHLGVMTASAPSLSGTASLLDVGSGAVALHGGNSATKALGGKRVMYAGDANGDNVLRYSGASNDRDLILISIGGTTPTDSVNGYFPEDLDMDGWVRYTGANNDRDLILTNIGGIVPTNVRIAQLP